MEEYEVTEGKQSREELEKRRDELEERVAQLERSIASAEQVMSLDPEEFARIGHAVNAASDWLDQLPGVEYLGFVLELPFGAVGIQPYDGDNNPIGDGARVFAPPNVSKRDFAQLGEYVDQQAAVPAGT